MGVCSRSWKSALVFSLLLPKNCARSRTDMLLFDTVRCSGGGGSPGRWRHRGTASALSQMTATVSSSGSRRQTTHCSGGTATAG